MPVVPLLDLTREYQELGAELEDAALRVLRSGRYIMGQEVDALEGELAGYLGVNRVVGLSSGTDALLAALMALHVGPGDKVLLPVYSFFATAGVVARLGATPVFVDIEPDYCNLDPDRLREALENHEQIAAAIVVHLYGAAADIQAIGPLLAERGIPMIEDAAQAIGTRTGGAMVGGMGTCGCFSTFPSKNLGGIGDGGFLSTDDEDFADRIRLLRNHGQAEAYRHVEIGGNFRLDALQAACLRVKLRHLEPHTEARRANAERYRELVHTHGLEDWIRLPTHVEDRHTYHQYVVHLPAADRDRVQDSLIHRSIGCAVYYPLPLHDHPCFAQLGYRKGDFPVAEEAAATNLALPIFPYLRAEESEEVVKALAEARNPQT